MSATSALLRPAAALLLGPDLPASDDATARKNLLALIQLRWLAVGGQILTIVVVHAGLRIDLPFGPMAAVLAALVLLNLTSLLRLRLGLAVTNAELFAILIVDVAALTAQLSLTGGASNPFTALYLLQVTLGAVLLRAWSAWTLVGLVGVSFLGLTEIYRPLTPAGSGGPDLFSLHLQGLLVCVLLDAALLVIFVGRVNRNLRERDARLADLRQRATEEDHIVRMGLLASGAAHELGTPLSTLSVILGDWRRMPALTADPERLEEIDAMQAEVQRCKAIVTGTLISAGEARGESGEVTTLHTFFDALVAEWRVHRGTPDLVYRNRLGQDALIAADSALKQAVVNVLDNAVQASRGAIEFVAAREGPMLVLTVADAGPGFAPDMLEGFGRPYQSSKGRPGGGLGLFLVVNVMRKLGGRAAARNRPGGGAEVVMDLPMAALEIRGRDG